MEELLLKKDKEIAQLRNFHNSSLLVKLNKQKTFGLEQHKDTFSFVDDKNI